MYLLTKSSTATDEAPRHEQFHALQKLRNEGSVGGSESGASSGLDGFAEVFAAMASSSPPPVQAEPEHKREVDSPASAYDGDPQHGRPETAAQNDGAAENSRVNGQESTDHRTKNQAADATPAQAPKTNTANTANTTTEPSVPSQEIIRQEATGDEVVEHIVDERTGETADPGEVSVQPITENSSDKEGETKNRTDSNQTVVRKDVESVNRVETRASTSADQSGENQESKITSVASEVSTDANPEHSSKDEGRRERRQDDSVAPNIAAQKKTGDAVVPRTADRPQEIAQADLPTDSFATPPTRPSPSVNVAAAAIASSAAAASSTAAAAVGRAAATAARSVSGTASTTNTLPTTSATNQASDPVAKTKPAVDGREEMISRVKLIQRVSRAFQGLGTEGGRVRLRLAPDDLGSVQVDMRVKNQSVDAQVIAQSEAAGAVLREHLPELRSRLESYGLTVERLDIQVESDSSAFDPDQSSTFENDADTNHHGSPSRDDGSQTSPDRSSSDTQPAPPKPLGFNQAAGTGGLDLQI